jgi:psiF repeat
MKACNNLADNKGLKGEDRKNFMQDCLSKAGNQQPNQMSQKDKMNVCNNLADRKNLTGSDRRSFIKDCISNFERQHLPRYRLRSGDAAGNHTPAEAEGA